MSLHERLLQEAERLSIYGPLRALDELVFRRDEFVIPLRAEHADLVMSVDARWRESFDGLELLVLLCEAVVRRAALADRGWGVAPTTYYSQALDSLFKSGVLVAREVLALLGDGYGTGALARWRALHETTTRAEFIGSAGPVADETARRYLEHESYRRHREAELLQGWRRKSASGLELAKPQLREFAEQREALCSRYGKAFLDEYGWAGERLRAVSHDFSEALAKGRRPRGATFDDLDATVWSRRGGDGRGWDFPWSPDAAARWRWLYARANGAVHGSPTSIETITECGEATMLSGPNLETVTASSAGYATAHRLVDLTRTMLKSASSASDGWRVPAAVVQTVTHLGHAIALGFDQ